MRGNEQGPHQITSVEEDSPAQLSGLLNNDLVLKVNDINVVGERYSKTITLIKNESEKGRLKLEVIQPHLCPEIIRNVPLLPSSTYSTVANRNSKKTSKSSDSVENLRDITAEAIETNKAKSKSKDDNRRAVSVDTGADRSKLAISMTEIDGTFRSNTTAFGDSKLTNSKSLNNLSQPQSQAYRPRFKRCVIRKSPDFNGYGFTLNLKAKPKFIVYSVDSKSPAYASGLRETDIIVEIDGKNIRKQKFEKVRQTIKDTATKGEVELLVIDREGYLFYKKKKKNFSSKKLISFIKSENDLSINVQNKAISAENVNVIEPSFNRTEQVVLEYETSKPSESTLNIQQQLQQPSRDQSPVTGQITTAPINTDMDFDNVDLIRCIVTRREDFKGIGISLAPGNQRTRSSSSSSKRSTDNRVERDSLPFITSIEPASPAENAGLKPGDLVVEINGKRANGLTNKKEIAKLIQSSGNQVEFLISREKPNNNNNTNNKSLIDEEAKQIALKVIEAAHNQQQQEESQQRGSPGRLSRKDLANESIKSSPKITHTEIKMSSTKLQQAESPSLKRNQSEPPASNENIQHQSSYDNHPNNNLTITPISRRSSSSYTLPNNAPIPRLCRVRAYEQSLGFIVSGNKATPGIFKVNDVIDNSPADHSGLQNDDFIIEVSGVNVQHMSYKEVVEFIKQKKQDDDLQILVADRQTVEWYKSRGIPISSNVVPKMQYIETLFKEELQPDFHTNAELNNNITIDSSFNMPSRIFFHFK
jgi:C-terminal processing protease CtpA/Prc